MSRRRKESKRGGAYNYVKFDELRVGDPKVAEIRQLVLLCVHPITPPLTFAGQCNRSYRGM